MIKKSFILMALAAVTALAKKEGGKKSEDAEYLQYAAKFNKKN